MGQESAFRHLESEQRAALLGAGVGMIVTVGWGYSLHNGKLVGLREMTWGAAVRLQ